MPTQSRKTILLATNLSGSVVGTDDAAGSNATSYTAYGYSPLEALQSQIRFNGELQELMTGHYPLGNGYRMYSPTLMRFISPDDASYSPFGEGGLNSYAYVGNNPITRADSTGHAWYSFLIRAFKKPKTKSTPFNPLKQQATSSNFAPSRKDSWGSIKSQDSAKIYASSDDGLSVLDLELFTPKQKKAFQPRPAIRSKTSNQSVAQPIAAPQPSPVQYRDPKAAEKIKYKLEKNEHQNNKHYLMDDYYNNKEKYERQLENLVIRKKT